MSPLAFILSLPLLLSLILILKYKKIALIIVVLALFYLFIAELFISRLLIFPLKFQLEQTIFSITEISNSISFHQQGALYLPYKLRLLFFNNLIYLYYIFEHAVYFFSLSNLQNFLLLANLYPLIYGLKKLISNQSLALITLILGSFVLTFTFLGLSRSVTEINFIFLIAPLIAYPVILGLKEINLKLYLALLILSLLIQLKTYP